MDEITQFLRGMTPGQIEQAVQLLRRHSTPNQWVAVGEQQQGSDGGNTNIPSCHAGEFLTPGEHNLKGAPQQGDNAVSTAVVLALRHAGGSVNNDCNLMDNGGGKSKSNDDDVDDEDDDIPLAFYASLSHKGARKRNSGGAKNARHEGPSLTEECCTPARKAKGSSKTAVAPLPASVGRGLTSFGFVSVSKKSVPAVGGTSKLFMPFLQDKRIVPPALRFWCHDGDMQQHPKGRGQEQERQAIVVDENSSSLMHSYATCGDSNEGEVMRDEKGSMKLPEGSTRRYVSFAEMIEDTTNNNKKRSHSAALEQCPCRFHVSLPAPRVGFQNEVVFCGFYAIGYDPCQSRPPYFGTYNRQEALNLQELHQLARFDTGGEMPQMSSLEYQYDSGDDWDVVEGDEDLGASSSSDTDDDEESGDSCLDSSDDDFINDNNCEDDDDDSDVELQRRMLEAQQRRVNRLRHKEKLVPAFSGPFVGVSMLDHPLRDYDRLERVSCALDGAAFTALLQQELRLLGAAAVSGSGSGGGGSRSYGEVGGVEEEKEQQRQRLIAAALCNRREMLPEELDGMHAIIAANGKIPPNAIVEAMRQQEWCAGVARAEILRTIRRYYERKHNTLVRRAEPWSVTDERLFTRQSRSRGTDKKNGNGSSTKDVNNVSEHGIGGHDEEGAAACAPRHDDDGSGVDDEDEDDLTFLELARKRPRVGESEVDDL